MKQKEDLKLSMEKEKKNEEMMKLWLENKKKETKKKYDLEIKAQKREHEQNLKSLQLMRKQMDDIIKKNKKAKNPAYKAKNRQSQSPRQKRAFAGTGLVLKANSIDKPKVSTFPQLSKFDFGDIKNYKHNTRYTSSPTEVQRKKMLTAFSYRNVAQLG